MMKLLTAEVAEKFDENAGELRFFALSRIISAYSAVKSFYARCVPPSLVSASTILADQSFTSSSRRVRSKDWNLARKRIEYRPDGTAPPRKISTGTKLGRWAIRSVWTAASILWKVISSGKTKDQSRSAAGNFGSG